MKKLSVILLVVGVVMAGFLFSMFFYSSAEAAPKVLKISHQWAKGDIRDLWANRWAELVKQKTNGEVEVKVYPAQSLFKAKAQFDAMRQGALDATVLHQIYLSGKIPAMSITSMLCLVRTAAQGASWGNHEIGKRLDEIGIRNGFRTLSWGCIMGNIGSQKRPVVLPKDVAGMKMRGAGDAVEETLFAAGASITSMPSTEIYFALQTGALDALTTTYSSFMSFKLYEALDYLTVSKDYSLFYAHVGILLANKTYDKLTQSQQKAVVEAGREAESYMVELAGNVQNECVKTYQDNGVKIINLTKEPFNEWLELSKKSAYKKYAEKVEDGQKLLDLALKVE
jgi:TRAP-type C4-dicarboxylate transport system substrate-binding protein